MMDSINHIKQDLKEDYERWETLVSNDNFSTPTTISTIDVLKAHYFIADFF